MPLATQQFILQASSTQMRGLHTVVVTCEVAGMPESALQLADEGISGEGAKQWSSQEGPLKIRDTQWLRISIKVENLQRASEEIAYVCLEMKDMLKGFQGPLRLNGLLHAAFVDVHIPEPHLLEGNDMVDDTAASFDCENLIRQTSRVSVATSESEDGVIEHRLWRDI